MNGHWEKGPGIELFQAIKARLGEKPIIAEDLGYVTDTVRRVKESGYPNRRFWNLHSIPEIPAARVIICRIIMSITA